MSAQHTPGPWGVSKRNAKRVVSLGKYRETDRRSIPVTVAMCESEDDALLIVKLFNDARREAAKATKAIGSKP